MQGRNLNLKASLRRELNLKRTRRLQKPRAKAYLPSAYRNVSQARLCTYSSSAKILAARSRIASSNAVVGWIVNLNYKEFGRGEI